MARRRVYQATPEKIWINDVDESSAAIRDIRVEVETTELQKVLRGHFFLKKKLSEVDRSAADEDE